MLETQPYVTVFCASNKEVKETLKVSLAPSQTCNWISILEKKTTDRRHEFKKH